MIHGKKQTHPPANGLRAHVFYHAAPASWNRFEVARNHVITRIKRSLLVGTNLISEFPAANYLNVAAMPRQRIAIAIQDH